MRYFVKPTRTHNNLIHLVKRKGGASPEEAHALLEGIRKAVQMDFLTLESEITESLGRLSRKYPDRMELIRSLKFKTPRSAFRWLESLSPEQRAGIRLALNSTLDGIYSDDRAWGAFISGGAVLSGTAIAYPRANNPMPGYLDVIHNFVRYVMDTRFWQGEQKIALVFDDYQISRSKGGKNNLETVEYIPKGNVAVITDFPQKSDWLVLRGGWTALGRGDQGRYIQRTERGFIGNIFRATETFHELDGSIINDERARVTIYARPTRAERFGLILEAPAHQEERVFGPVPEKKQLELPAQPKEAPKRVMPQELFAMMRHVIAYRTMEYISDPDLLHADILASREVGEELAGIAGSDRELQNRLRETVRGLVDWTYLQNSPLRTVEQTALAFWRLCDALGVPNEAFDAELLKRRK